MGLTVYCQDNRPWLRSSPSYRGPFITSPQAVLASAVVAVGGETYPSADGREALLASQTFQDNSDLLLGRVIPTGPALDLPDHRSRLLLVHLKLLYWMFNLAKWFLKI